MSLTDPAAAAALPGTAEAAPATPLGRLVPALMLSQVGNYIALLTPLQLLLTLRLSELASGTAATSAFGIVTGFGALFALVFNPIGGRISDLTTARFGRRRTWILFGALAGAAALVALAFATAIWQIVVLWCATQALFNFQSAATTATIADQVPAKRRGGVSGLMGFTIAAGPLLGLGIANTQKAGSHNQWLIIAGIAAVLGIVAVVLIKEHRQPPRNEGFGWAGIGQTFWRNPARYPAFAWAWLVRFLITCAYASSTYNAFYLIQRFHESTDEVGGVVLTLSLISVVLLAVASVVGGYISDAIKRQKPFVVVAGVIAAIGLLLMAFAPSIAFVYVATALTGLGTGIFFAIDLAMCVRVLPNSEDAGKDLAIINMANSLPQSIVPFIAPVLLAIGGYTAFFAFLAVLGVAGAIAVAFVPEVGKENAGGIFAAPLHRPKTPTAAASSPRLAD
ncbi:MFS transporter [Gryllotalpicola koreensis]|uniref:MFS transporter n=1 Tax=Gryllotalpicola koreensis TaxID=993086 RepID=A0ABP8ACV2_9MICO